MKETLEFLSELATNNNREWMAANKKRYEKARLDYLDLVDAILQELQKSEPGLAHLKAKDCVFRLNRDVRFSADKSPYKINFAAYICPEGRKSFAPGYYLHLQPGASFIAGGIYMPGSDWLKKIRQEIDYNAEPLLKYLADKKVKATFGDIEGESLKRPPKGYQEEHPHIALLKRKTFLLQHPLKDADLLQEGLGQAIAGKFKLLKPFLDYFRVAIEDVEGEEMA
jgi:uncharacterized protein (TIGR02453 family)